MAEMELVDSVEIRKERDSQGGGLLYPNLG
jgi:hypothetical protein